MRASFDKGGLCVIRQDGAILGCCQAVPHAGHVEVASFYLEPSAQGQGLGRAVLAALLPESPALPVRIEVMKGSPARAFWERMGFVVTGEAGVDWHMEHPPRA